MTTLLAHQDQVLLHKILCNNGSVRIPAPATKTRYTRAMRAQRRVRQATRPAPAAPVTLTPAPAVADLSFDCGAAAFDSVAALAADTASICGGGTEPIRVAAPSDRIIASFARIDLASLPVHCGDDDVLGPYVASDHATAWSALGFAVAAAAPIGADLAGIGDDVLAGAIAGDAAAGSRDAFRLVTGPAIDLSAASAPAMLETEIWGMGDDVLAGAADDRIAALASDRLCA